MTHTPIATIDVKNTLGEGVLWDDLSQCVWWTDIEEKKLYCLTWPSRDLTVFDTPERLCSYGLTNMPGCFVAAFETGFALYWPKENRIKWFDRPALHTPGIRFNDGRVDRQGRFWAGTMVEKEGAGLTAGLYCLSSLGSVRLAESGIQISNGLCWSPDSKTMYFADSPRQKFYSYSFAPETGAISNQQQWVTLSGEAYPDGACTDASGYVWNATWAAGKVIRYSPDGTVDRSINIPASQPTCAAFGGPDLNLLFVTSARAGLDDAALELQPHAGSLFIYECDFHGLPECRFPAISHIK